MKIAKLTIHNFLKLKDVEINPSHTNVIVGKNKQGKTSILKAIRTAFDGKADASSIRIGETKAEITVELDELTIRRSITEKGNYLDISNAEGMKMPAPQKYLDGILGTFSFNPIEFFDKKPVERKKYLLNAIKLTINQEQLAEYTGEPLIGLDYENTHALEIVELARKYYYDKRTVANAEVTKKKKVLEELTAQIPADFKPGDVSEEQIAAFRAAIQKDKEEAIRLEAHQTRIRSLRNQEGDIEGQILNLQQKLKAIQQEIVEALDVKFDVSDPVAIEAAESALASLESKRELVYTVKRADEVRSELDIAVQEATKLDDVVKRLSKEIPDDLIAKANLPIEGLVIDGDEILINGVSVDNMSTSEQLRLGLQVVRALNGQFKVICVDGIEALDKESFEFFLKEIENDDYQYFVTRVEGDSEHSIVVEDGEVKTN
jgi:predicted ATP-dependent endonuclease of OLD family